MYTRYSIYTGKPRIISRSLKSKKKKVDLVPVQNFKSPELEKMF